MAVHKEYGEIPDKVEILDDDHIGPPSSGKALIIAAGELENFFVTASVPDLTGHTVAVEVAALTLLRPGDKVVPTVPPAESTPAA